MEWNITGVAIGTIFGEVLAFIVGLAVCWRLLDHSVRPSRNRILEFQAWKRLIALNADIMVRSFALLFAFAYFTSQGAAFGKVTLAANAVLMHFFMIAGYFLDGLATAAEQICGRAVGANYKYGFWRGLKLSGFWNMIMAIVCTIIFISFGPFLIDLMTTSQEVRNEAYAHLYWSAMIPLTGVLAFQMDGVFIGATWSRDMSVFMVLSLILYLLTWQLVKQPMGNHGLWFSLHVFVIARGITLFVRVPGNVRKTFG